MHGGASLLNKGKDMSSDAIGQHYCLCELLLEGREAYLANSLTQKGWDIAILDENRIIRIQVKCINWESRGQAVVKGTFIEKEFDYLVIVLLKYKEKKFTPFVIPYEKLREKKGNQRTTLIDKDGFVYFSARKKKKGDKGVEKQAIAISKLQNDNVYKMFDTYRENFGSIMSVELER